MKPLKFQPLLKSTIWGGSKIITFKHLDVKQENVGESWEISGVPENESIVADGEMQGKSLNEVVAERKGSFLGEENYKRFGNEFPLLIKFIDANRDLSIQVHPNDEIAKKQGKERGKTEMWYALPCEPDAKLYNGLKMQITPEQYKEMVENDTITDALAQYNVKEDDCFFIPAGRIHTIGTGCFVVEIQQTSDVTYRIYDFKRKDKDGNYRQLHTKEAAECIDYTVLPDYRQHYTPAKNQGVSMVQCPYFTTAVYDLDEPMTLDYSELDSFVILIGLKGEAKITDNEGNEITLQGGESIVFTFEPHPRITLGKADGLRLLTTLDEKTALLEELGVDNVIVIPFDRAFSALSGEEFADDYLIGKVGAETLVAGYNHRFGHDRIDCDTLAASGRLRVVKVGPCRVDGEHVSSTVIRRLLDEGKTAEAELLLGYSLQTEK